MKPHQQFYSFHESNVWNCEKIRIPELKELINLLRPPESYWNFIGLHHLIFRRNKWEKAGDQALYKRRTICTCHVSVKVLSQPHLIPISLRWAKFLFLQNSVITTTFITKLHWFQPRWIQGVISKDKQEIYSRSDWLDKQNCTSLQIGCRWNI